MKLKSLHSKGSTAMGLMMALIAAALFMMTCALEAASADEGAGSPGVEILKDVHGPGEHPRPALLYSALDDDASELVPIYSRVCKGLFAGVEARMPAVPYSSSFPGEQADTPCTMPVHTTVLRL